MLNNVVLPCAMAPEDYQDDELEPIDRLPASAEWSAWSARRAAAHRRCAGCPVMTECLYRAVVEVDVSGFVACTTEEDRQAIRRKLGIQVEPQLLSNYGTPAGGGPVSHESVLAARQAYPQDTCQQLAERLGCSTSTIKRHLRRAREQAREQHAVPRPPLAEPPTMDAVLDCFDELETSHIA